MQNYVMCMMSSRVVPLQQKIQPLEALYCKLTNSKGRLRCTSFSYIIKLMIVLCTIVCTLYSLALIYKERSAHKPLTFSPLCAF